VVSPDRPDKQDDEEPQKTLEALHEAALLGDVDAMDELAVLLELSLNPPIGNGRTSRSA
jgi:hypothetical protein